MLSVPKRVMNWVMVTGAAAVVAVAAVGAPVAFSWAAGSPEPITEAHCHENTDGQGNSTRIHLYRILWETPFEHQTSKEMWRKYQAYMAIEKWDGGKYVEDPSFRRDGVSFTGDMAVSRTFDDKEICRPAISGMQLREAGIVGGDGEGPVDE